MGVYGRLGGIEQPLVRGDATLDLDDEAATDREVVTDGPMGWDFESAPWVSPYRRLPPAAGVVYAELPLRVVAFLIDLTVMGIAVGILAPAALQVYNVFVPSGGLFILPPEVSVVGYLVLPMVAYVLASAVVSIYFWTRFRATPGQMILGLFTVTRLDGLPLTTHQAILRWLLVFGPASLFAGSTSLVLAQVGASTIAGDGFGRGVLTAAITVLALGWYGVLGATIAWDRRGRGLHDRLVGSVVVRRDGSPS